MDNAQIDLKLVFEHLQKQAAESEIVKWALDAAFRQAVVVAQQDVIEKLERALEAKGESGRSGGIPSSEQGAGVEGGSSTDGLSRGPKLVRSSGKKAEGGGG